MLKSLPLLLALSLFHYVCPAQTAPKRELRGAWIATYANIDWPNRTQTPAQQRAAFLTIVDHHKATGITSLYIQVRSQCDALYPSSIDPWSADLTGTQGIAPSTPWDPMQFMIEECHKRGIEFHAWINPYRAVANANNLPSFAANHVAKQHPDWLLSQGTLRVLDPGLPQVRNYITSVITDIVNRYDVDGIHFDDYFYPPAAGAGVTPYNDDSTYNADPRGFTVRGDWRRDNINLLISRLYDTIKVLKPWVKFGVSPSGIYRNSNNPEIGTATSGLEHYTTLYADTKRWLQEGWVDYIMPQVYWYMGQPGANYSVIVPWWNNQANNRHIYIGLAGYKVNDPAQGVNWANPSQIPNEVRYNRSFPYVYGQSVYNTSSMRSATKLGFRDSLRLDFYSKPALLPNMPWRDSIAPDAPNTVYASTSASDSIVLTWQKPVFNGNESDRARQFAIYRSTTPAINTDSVSNLLAITNTDTTVYIDKSIAANTTYYYLVTSLDRHHNESVVSNISTNTVPEIVCPGNQELPLTTNCSATMPDYTSLAVVNDTTGITFSQIPAAGSPVTNANNLVTLIATNAGGKADTCYFNVTTTDTSAPVLTAAIANNGSVILPGCTFTAGTQYDVNASDCSPVSYSYTLSRNGNTSAPVNATCLQGVNFAQGNTTVTWTVTDAAGNAAEYRYDIIVADQQAPVISKVYVTPPVLVLPNNQMRNVFLYYEVTDNCGSVNTTISVTSNDPAATNDWEVIDNHHLKLRAVRSKAGQYRVYTITVTATDAAGNTTTQQVQVCVVQFIYAFNEQTPGALDVTVKPNPAVHQFTLVLTSKTTAPLQLRILDMTGRIVETRNNAAANSTLTLGANYKPGIYFAEVTQNGARQVITLIKL
ncbi:family 10 glycosylhydrolase [Chitinophaga horti]|uniref:Family 10 glycosylhydrolase n=1 Tax=Chitinophaga horti TaxID=2920382 RepID=A0ABY6J1X1_9BACT|nr:family 10 glycosylhydrolase [Chitinophaga horti]UYQ92632.1 family 10 glycosylhydrolase [Chitinophaga horti]